MRNIMRVTPVSRIEREPWGAAIILGIVNDGVYVCTCSVRYDKYNCKTKHSFFLQSLQTSALIKMLRGSL